MKVLVTPTSMQPGKYNAALERLKAFTDDLIFNETGKPLPEDDMLEHLKECDGCIAGLDSITAKVIDACPNLKVISRYGAGYDRVDVAEAKKKGIKVTNTPGVNAEAVGELSFGLILSVARSIPYLNEETRKGGWVRSSGIELKGKTLGILGLGAIGKVVARCGQGFGMHVMAYDPFMNEEYCKTNAIDNCPLEEVFEKANVISLHLPLNDETYHMVGRAQIEKMQEGTILINASRGGIIDEDAAYDALKTGKLAGLGLDAFEKEPPVDSKLFEFPTVVATPHSGSHTKEAVENMASLSVENLIAVLSGEECRYVVNK